jgi:hypothetical protein
MPWTDSNAHDPGITVLEVLSYSLAALSIAALLGRRVRGAPCGWPCVGLVVASAAGVAAIRRAGPRPARTEATGIMCTQRSPRDGLCSRRTARRGS